MVEKPASTTQSEPSATSPCVRVCALDERTGVCLGCGRTLAEIAAWSSMSEAERLAWMTAAQSRRSGS
jgi:predicted Fe-S protein YdhL (DUF1289 family)